jgi:O-methyltransferase
LLNRMLQDSRINRIIMNTPFRNHFLYKYSFYFTVAQLLFLCNCLENSRNAKGAVVEVGCWRGLTTVFLNKYMDDQKIEKTYYAIDTFSGFVAQDLKYEISERGKTRDLFGRGFRANDQRWFDYTMQLNDIHRVKSIKADVNKFDLSKLGPFSFVLLDVDLYRPTRKCLTELYKMLMPGGIIVVDDCDSENILWNGSDQAYKEFMEEINQPNEIVHNKLGIVRK